ncbi:unnamed protein product [Trichogramma brassicae]|uniref:Uncharacterized protein n=1 Tax=Trichogramma brassicae TaxID=86971 RepID=A0A6H5I5E6_9HYME|nr:unnamed protein product [Trichogramma brassicae]
MKSLLVLDGHSEETLEDLVVETDRSGEKDTDSETDTSDSDEDSDMEEEEEEEEDEEEQEEEEEEADDSNTESDSSAKSCTTLLKTKAYSTSTANPSWLLLARPACRFRPLELAAGLSVLLYINAVGQFLSSRNQCAENKLDQTNHFIFHARDSRVFTWVHADTMPYEINFSSPWIFCQPFSGVLQYHPRRPTASSSKCVLGVLECVCYAT